MTDGHRIAVVVTGTLQRYHLNATLTHLLWPSIFDQGHAVDVYLSLSMNSAAPFRSEMEYMNHLAWDPLLFDAASSSSNQTESKKTLPSPRRLNRFIEFQTSLAGAVPRHVQLLTDLPDWSEEPAVLKMKQQSPEAFSKDGVPLQFPVRDQRPGNQESNMRANRNILTVFYALKQLWEKVVEMEASLDLKYDYVLFLRDDARFVKDMNWGKLLRQEESIDAYILSCDNIAKPMHPRELNDYGGLYHRKAAAVYGMYWDALFRDGVQERCAQHLESSFRKYRVLKSPSGSRKTTNCGQFPLLPLPRWL